jgi:hypothetical protein
MNETEMSAYWFTLSAYFPTWTMPNVDDDAGLATRSLWCHAFRDVSFVDARDAIEALPPSRFAPSLGELVAAAKGTKTLKVSAGECFGKLRSVINSCGNDPDEKREMCDRIDPYMWGTIQGVGGLHRIGGMSEDSFNTYFFLEWVKTFTDVANGARSQVVHRKSLPGAIKDSLGEILKRRPQIEGGSA